ncbi:hypothetical protein FB45DRAFT_901741, partial [Roridomyces roridus]
MWLSLAHIHARYLAHCWPLHCPFRHHGIHMISIRIVMIPGARTVRVFTRQARMQIHRLYDFPGVLPAAHCYHHHPAAVLHGYSRLNTPAVLPGDIFASAALTLGLGGSIDIRRALEIPLGLYQPWGSGVPTLPHVCGRPIWQDQFESPGLHIPIDISAHQICARRRHLHLGPMVP